MRRLREAPRHVGIGAHRRAVRGLLPQVLHRRRQASGARPVTPRCAVAVVDGPDVTDHVRRSLVELRAVSTTDRTTDTVEIALSAGDGGVLAAPPTGRELAVSLGYAESGLVTLGRYWHTETEIECAPSPRIVVRATGADLRRNSALKTPRTRAWHDTTLGAVLDAICSEHGLSPAVDETLAAQVVAHEDQTAESDLHFVRRLAARHDADAKAVGGQLVFAAAGRARSAGGLAMPTVDLSPASGVVALRVSYRDRPSVAAVRAPYWVYVAAAPMHAIAGQGTPAHDLPDPYPDRPTAQAAADAALHGFVRAAGTLEATIPGLPHLSAGCGITTSGWPDATANGRWTATRIAHTLSATTGYTTAITASPAR